MSALQPIFMLSRAFFSRPQIHTRLPAAGTLDSAPARGMLLTLDAGDEMQSLEERVAIADSQRSIAISRARLIVQGNDVGKRVKT